MHDITQSRLPQEAKPGENDSYQTEPREERSSLPQKDNKQHSNTVSLKPREECFDDTDIIETIEKRFKKTIEAFRKQTYHIDTLNEYRYSIYEKPIITSVVGAKSGVGKSLISLGLAEAFSVSHNILLLDFDLHNKGLTSRRNIFNSDVSTVLGEMKRFNKEITPKLSGKKISELSLKEFILLRNEFCFKDMARDILESFKPLKLYLHEDKDGKPQEPLNINEAPIRPENCYFLPSRGIEEIYINSEESRYDSDTIAMFILFIATLAKRTINIQHVIIYCHGAQDMLMVGTILVSDNIVVVARPETTAFEGTIELIEFTDKIRGNNTTQKKALIFNEYRESDKGIANALYEVVKDKFEYENFDSVPKINSDDSVRDMLKHYHKPAIVKNTFTNKAIQNIMDGFKIKS